jgi:hypothetical protein
MKMSAIIEAVDTIDLITLDVPTFIRMLEWAREDVKTDAELHVAATNAISMRKTLTMADYKKIINQN